MKKKVFINIIFFVMGGICTLGLFYLYKIKYSIFDNKVNTKVDLMNNYVFTSPNNNLSILAEVKNSKDLTIALSSFKNSKVPFQSLFFNIKKLKLKRIKNDVVELAYCIQEKEFHTYAYFSKSKIKSNISAFIIPGSGSDVSTKIHTNKYVEGEYLDELLLNYADTFIFVKPNEDFLTIHNGMGKLSNEFVYYHLLNGGYSYSNLYLQHCLAFIKYLKLQYKEVSTFGVSQGGMANLIVSQLAEPTESWVCAGFSVLFDELYWAGQNQIVGNNMYEMYQSDSVLNRIKNSKTIYHFSYGSNDNDFYKYEYSSKETEKKLKLRNTNFIYFKGGHDFPYKEISQYYVRNSRRF